MFLGEKVKELEQGKTVMLMAETGDQNPKRCLYASKKVMKDDDEAKGCFPAAARFHLGGGFVEAREVEHGMALPTGRVLAFSHRDDSETQFPYVKIVPEDGGEALVVSPGHYVVLDSGVLRAAASVRIGDVLKGSVGTGRSVKAVERIMARGRVNPHTASGVVHVEGFEVSCYTTAVHPTVARAGIRILDFLGRWVGENTFRQALERLAEPERLPERVMRLVPAGSDSFEL